MSHQLNRDSAVARSRWLQATDAIPLRGIRCGMKAGAQGPALAMGMALTLVAGPWTLAIPAGTARILAQVVGLQTLGGRKVFLSPASPSSLLNRFSNTDQGSALDQQNQYPGRKTKNQLTGMKGIQGMKRQKIMPIMQMPKEDGSVT